MKNFGVSFGVDFGVTQKNFGVAQKNFGVNLGVAQKKFGVAQKKIGVGTQKNRRQFRRRHPKNSASVSASISASSKNLVFLVSAQHFGPFFGVIFGNLCGVPILGVVVGLLGGRSALRGSARREATAREGWRSISSN